MDRGTSSPQTTASRNQPVDPGPDPRPCPTSEAAPGKVLKLGQSFLRSVRYFFPQFNDWLDRLPDARDQDAIIYVRRFLGWYGILLYVLQLGSRRQLDFHLDTDAAHVLANLNQLANTEQTSRPVHDTLDYFLGKSRASAIADVRTQMIRRLIRMKVLDDARLLGRLVVVVDGTGWVCFRVRHCDYCLVQRHEHYTLYMHQVLEAKVLGPDGLTLSMGSVFIENADAPMTAKAAEAFKQDCELN